MVLARRFVLAAATVVAARAFCKPARAADDDPDGFRPLSAIVPLVPPAALLAVRFATLDGGQKALADFHGKPVVLNFWATWCVPCVKELPELDRLAAAAPDIAVVAVSADHNGAAAVRPFLAAHAVRHATVLLDGVGDAVHALGVVGFPTTLIVDAQGRLRGRLEGPAAWGGAAAAVRDLTR